MAKGRSEVRPHAPVVAQDYLDFCRGHMRSERDLMPTLRQAVSDAEWNAISDSLRAVNDPLAAARSRRQREMALEGFD